MILGYYPVQKGNVSVLDSKNVSMIHQESHIFDDTIRNNLNMELVQTDETLLKCMEFVDLQEFKLDQNICEDGSNLSGGQVQRIGIARTIAHFSNTGIVPVVKILEKEDAYPLAKALLNGGIDVIEVTYRSEHATSAIQTISEQLPDMLVGAGTVLSVEQAKEAVEAGAKFIITPGFNTKVVQWCLDHDVEVYPGVSTASEVEMALSMGLTQLKFFPAESSGGAKKLKDLSAPYANVHFMPTGGINTKNMHDYLSLPNVEAIGGSFMLPNDLVVAKDWDGIEALSRSAIKSLLDFQLIHVGINTNSPEESKQVTDTLCSLFHFTQYTKPKSNFAGVGFEVLHKKGRGENGHIGIYTPYPEKAMYHLSKQGVKFVEESITRNKKTNRINFVYLDLEIAGFGIHLINPDLKMEI